MKKKIAVWLALMLLLISNLSISSTATEYRDELEKEVIVEENESIQPLYDIIHRLSFGIVDDGVEASMETDFSTSLQITITLYQQKENGWSLLAKKTFSRTSTVLGGRIEYDFKSGVTYRAVANFNAGGERETIEDERTF